MYVGDTAPPAIHRNMYNLYNIIIKTTAVSIYNDIKRNDIYYSIISTYLF